MRFLHCSDVHITADYRAIPFLRLGWRRWIALGELTMGGRAAAYADAPQVLASIVRDFERHGGDHLILSGDLTAYALEEEFRGAAEALGGLVDDPLRCTVIPGNHDVYTPGSRKEARFERYFGGLIQSDLPELCAEGPFPFVRLLGDQAAVIGLSSARVPAVPGMSFGVIGKRQLQALEQLVAHPKVKDRAVLVAVHHAPLDRDGGKDKLHHGLVDGSALFKIIAGPRFAVLHGHIHKRYYHPATSRQPHTFGAGSSTQLGKEGYWVIEVEDGRIVGAQSHRPADAWPVSSSPLPDGGAPTARSAAPG